MNGMHIHLAAHAHAHAELSPTTSSPPTSPLLGRTAFNQHVRMAGCLLSGRRGRATVIRPSEPGDFLSRPSGWLAGAGPDEPADRSSHGGGRGGQRIAVTTDSSKETPTIQHANTPVGN